MLLGLVVLAVGVMVGGLQVMVRRCMMVGRRHRVMLDRRMLVLFWHSASS
jgi:hypothetical protein